MTIFARLSATASDRLSDLGAPLRLLGVLTASVMIVWLLVPARSQALVKVVEGRTVGLQSPNSDRLFDGTLEENELNVVSEHLQAESFSNEAGNPVVHGSAVYAVYWDPTNSYHGDWQHLVNGFLHDVGGQSSSLGSVFAVNAQYTDVSNKPASNQVNFRGTYPDSDPYPVAGCTDPRPLQTFEAHHIHAISCLTDEQVSQELQSFISTHGLPTGMNTVYYLLTPPGVAVCLDAGGATGHCSSFEASEKEFEEGKFTTASYKNSFCSYHSDVNPGKAPTGDASTVLYGVIPWTAGGLADGQLKKADRHSAFYCQDGGFNPVSSPIEQRESPVQQEPNQPACPSPDGFCDSGLADLIINQIAVEQQNIVTNPLLNAWQDFGGNEATDECRNFFSPAVGSHTVLPGSEAGTLTNQTLGSGHYYLNTAFNLAAVRLGYPGVQCVPGVNLQPSFTAPSTVNAGDVVGFDGMESNITLNSAFAFSGPGTTRPNYATYTWSFGDGTPNVSGYAPGAPACSSPWLSPCAAGVFHSYTYGGSYQVTLTVTDVAGNTASTAQQVDVVGPAAPSSLPSSGSTPPATSSSSASPGPASSSSGKVTGGGGSATSVPPPVAAAAAASHSLRSVVRHGLVIRYSVNEQVAGHFDVLLSRDVARRLGIGGPPAAGLPAGTPPQVVVGRAILVTTAAGRSSVTIHLSKRTAARLGRMRKVNLMVRLTVRNASSHSPATTTVLSTVTLSR